MALEVTKAPGVDGVTKAYGQNLEENLRALQKRQMSYRPQPVRRVEWEDGTIRLLGISCIEDKIVRR